MAPEGAVTTASRSNSRSFCHDVSVTIYSSDRRFEVWRWGVGHTGLLLRSNPPSDGQPRIEVLFKPAHAVCLPTLLEGLVIDQPHAEALPGDAFAAVGRGLREWEHFYTVTSHSVSGWVIGGSVSGRQDQENYSAPTMFDGWAPGEQIIPLFEVNAS